MYKTNDEIIEIEAKATAPLNTGVVFWSHDRGTAKFVFRLTKDGVNQSLSTGTLVPISLDFVIGEVQGKHIYHAVIEDAVNGIVSFVLQDQILWFKGKVTGSIYIELPDTRSLDTAGRFTFDIKRSPIDLSTPPEQHFYWDGFNEILQEYDKTIELIQSESKKLLDNLTTNVNNAQTKVNKLEQDIDDANTELNTRVNEIHAKIDNEEIYRKSEVFTKEESSANVIYQIIGKEEVELTFSLDLKGKIAGSDTENRNSYKYFNINNGTLPTTITGSELKNTGDWDDYSRVFDVDGKLFTTSAMVADRGVGHAAVWNLLQVVKDTLGNEFFSDQGAMSISGQTALIRNRSSSLIASMWGYGSNPTGNKLTIKTLRTSDLVWAYEGYHNKDSVQKLTTVINPASIPYYISEDGFVTQCAFSDASDGSTASMARVDYATLEFKMKISMNEYIKNVIAANHVGNLATQEEAVMGEDNTKTMTPLRVNEALENKTVSITGNQTVGGIKNFRDGLLLNDIPLSSITRKVVYEADGIGGYFNQSDKFILGVSEKIDRVVLLWSRVDDVEGTLLNYSWSQTVLSPDDIILGYSYRIQLTNENYKFVTFANEMGKITISGANENSVAPNRIYRIKRIISYIKD